VASPTPLLIVVAAVGLVPAATPTRPAPTAAAVKHNAPPAPTAVPALPLVGPPPSGDVAAAEQYTVDLINARRAAAGIAPLAPDATLMSIARGRVADMVARGYTGHNDPVTGAALGPAMMRAAGFGGPVGENWYGTLKGPPSIADVAMTWFMTDPAHYRNILGVNYFGVGVGIAFNGRQWLLVQDFAGN
jgi:uncharacterized protein YkwD